MGWKCGVELYVLGQPVPRMKFKTYVSVIVGDGVALQKMAGIKGGNCFFSCIKCLFNHRTETLMIEEPLVLRDMEDSMIIVENADLLRRTSNGQYCIEAKAALKDCAALSLLPLYNTFFKIPMGVGNNLYKNCPVDVMHTYQGGLVKMCIRFILMLVFRANDMTGMHGNLARFDGRILYCKKLLLV